MNFEHYDLAIRMVDVCKNWVKTKLEQLQFFLKIDLLFQLIFFDFSIKFLNKVCPE